MADATDLREPAVTRWLDTIKRYDRQFDSWTRRVKKIYDIYTDQRSNVDSDNLYVNRRKFNLLWANISTLQPAVYSKMPEPSINRRFKDDDSVARVASELMERCAIYQGDRSKFDQALRHVRDDFLICGRGQVWLRYVPDVVQTQLGPQLVGEDVAIDHVAWDDFGHNVARTWDEVTSVWRKVYLTREELKSRFPEHGAKVGLDHKPETNEGSDDPNVVKVNKATVYEIWDKASGKVWFIAKSYDKVLEESDPFLDFEDFFPCPRPVYATVGYNSLVPYPDYVFYQDQVEEIDDLTVRIGKLTDVLKLVGWYASGSSDASVAIEKGMKAGTENELIPVPAWSEWKEGGGASGLIEWLPVDQVIKVIEGCITLRKQLIEDVYQITGISDIMRGESDPNETASAQQIKAEKSSVRIRDKQQELARFARDAYRLMTEIICEKFQPETLLKMSNMDLPTQAQVAQQQLMAAMQAQQAPAMPPPPMAAPQAPAGAPQAGPGMPPLPGPAAPQQPGMQQ